MQCSGPPLSPKYPRFDPFPLFFFKGTTQMTKENVIPMQFLQLSCLGSCNFPKDKRSKWKLGWRLSLTPLHCPNQVSQGWSELAPTNAPVEDEPVQPVLRMNILPTRCVFFFT